MAVENLLITTNLGNGSFFNVNAGATQHDGFEGLIKLSPFAKEEYEVHLTTAYTFSNYTFEEFNDGNIDYSGNELTGIPRHTLQSAVDFEYKIKKQMTLYGNVHYQFIDAMPINDANTVYADSYQVTNLKLGLRIGFESVFLNFYGGINNLFDERYASMLAVNARGFGSAAPRYYYPGFPRHYYGGLSVRWNF
jgi:iron complex outermembrane receptor protein